MENFVIKHYHNDNVKCISDFDTYFYEQEFVNSILLTVFKEKIPTSRCSVIVDKNTNTLIFALFALQSSFLYASGISKSVEKELHAPIVDLLVKDFLSSSFSFTSFHGFDPALSLVKASLESHTDTKYKSLDSVWSHDIEQVDWSPRALEIKNNGSSALHQATTEDLALLKVWTQGFIDDLSKDFTMGHIDLDELCLGEINKKHVYFLYCDNVPVSMAWKRRPLRNTCSLAYVYTPPEHREKGYGKACVSMITESILEEYKYVTLFVNANKDPNHNLYTSMGYRFIGKAGRYAAIV